MIMQSLLLWSGCGPTVPTTPAGVPAGTPALWVDDGDVVRLGPQEVVHWSAIAEAPTEPIEETLAAGLKEGPLWVSLPPETAFWGVRRTLGSAKEAGAGPVYLSARGAPEAFLLPAAPKYQLLTTCEAPIPVTGVDALVTWSLQGGLDEAWVIASARFVPVTAGGPTDGLPPECLAVPPCETLFPEGPLRTACTAQAGQPAPDRVTLGGERGCLLPIAKQPADVARWRPEIAKLVGSLGLADRKLLVVMPEAWTRLDALLAIVGGFVDAGLPVPAVGTTALVEGNDGPPVCNATVQDAAGFAEASARWLGGHHAAAGATPAPAAGATP
jgi:hypothetical protein